MKLFKSFLSVVTVFLVMFMVSCNIEPYEDVVLEDDNTAVSCIEATENIVIAALNFTNATDLNYIEKCNAYKEALQNQKSICGDEDGSIQLIINSLNCDVDNQENNCESITVIVSKAKEALDIANDLNYADLCVAYKAALQSKIITCGDVDGSIQSIIDNLGDCTKDIVASTGKFMTANIDGIQYNDMKPNGYLFFGSATSVNGFFTRTDDDYLVLQGNSGYQNPTSVNTTDKEINIKIPSINWKEGTYVLYDDLNDVDEGVSYYTFFAFDRPDVAQKDLEGEMIITKFSLEERVIQGTFEFEYKLIDESDNSETGPFKVTGTFDYDLDDEFFD